MKFKEDLVIAEVLEYIRKTYDEHYVGKGELQALDVIDSLNEAGIWCKGNVIKYAMRYGKKAGKNKSDILKAIHYLILMYYFEGFLTTTTDGEKLNHEAS